MDIPVLYEDRDVLAVAKPPGIVVIPARGEDPEASLRHVLARQRGETLWVVHRIDRDTSGVVLLARTAEGHRALSLAFEQRAVTKTYLALTRGALPAPEGSIAAALHPARKGKMRPALEGEPGAVEARTEYAVRARWTTRAGAVALVEARPRTGRQHQIRVHLRSVGAPLLVDPLYGRAARVTWAELGREGDGVACARLTLHALALAVPAPRGGGTLRVEAPLAADLAALVAGLGQPTWASVALPNDHPSEAS